MTIHPDDEDQANDDRQEDLLDIYMVVHDLHDAVEDDEEEEEDCHQVTAELPARWPITWEELATKTANDATLQIVKEYVVDKARPPTKQELKGISLDAVSYTHLRAHETTLHLVCRLLLEKKKMRSSY